MNFLPLDDPRWKDLDHGNWRDADGRFVPDELSKLAKSPADRECFTQLWPYLCSQDTTYAAAYAAVPYFVRFAKQVPPEKRFDYLCIIGLVVAHSAPDGGKPLEMKDYLEKDYRAALAEALLLIGETLASDHDITETRYLLGAMAAIKGHRKLAKILQDMDCICGQCPKCGECVFPEELQEALA